MINYTGFILVTTGALFIFTASISILRFDSFYSRLACFVKLAALGIILLMLGVIAFCGFSALGIKALILGAFIIVTLPVEARKLANAAVKSGIKLTAEDDKDRFKSLRV